MGCGCGDPVIPTIQLPAPAEVTLIVSSARYTGPATLAAGARSMSFLNDSGGTILLNGVILKPMSAMVFPFLAQNIRYPAITIDATGGEVRVDRFDLP